MVWPRYIAYFAGITLVTWVLTQLEVSYPGSLRLHVFAYPGDALGTSEFSPVEIMQPFILGICGALLAWVAKYCPSQRPIAFPFGGLALVFLIRECDYFLDRFLIDNLWQLLIGVALALVIVYTYRARRRLRIAWFQAARKPFSPPLGEILPRNRMSGSSMAITSRFRVPLKRSFLPRVWG